MMNYTVRRVSIGDTFCISFDFEPDNYILSGFLFTDSRLVFGHRFEDFNDIMKYDTYEAGGNAYVIEIYPENVNIACTVDIENEEEMSISREEFVWVMNEWIREFRKNEQANAEAGKSHCVRQTKTRSVYHKLSGGCMLGSIFAKISGRKSKNDQFP